MIKGVKISPVDMDARKKLPITSGDTVKVWQKINELDSKGKERTRLQGFEGIVLSRKHGSEAGATFTVRRVVDGVGVERIFPLYSPLIDKIEVLRRAKVRRSKLYYIRDKAAKEIRRSMRNIMKEKDEVVAEEPKVETEAKKEEVVAKNK